MTTSKSCCFNPFFRNRTNSYDRKGPAEKWSACICMSLCMRRICSMQKLLLLFWYLIIHYSCVSYFCSITFLQFGSLHYRRFMRQARRTRHFFAKPESRGGKKTKLYCFSSPRHPYSSRARHEMPRLPCLVPKVPVMQANNSVIRRCKILFKMHHHIF